jgi:serine/threonine protein kinase
MTTASSVQSPPPDQHLGRNRSEESLLACAKNTVSISNPEPLPHPPASDKCLVLASKFGFMIESCILSARKNECMICPAHRTHPLPIRDIAPDVVFADLPTHFLLDGPCVDKGVYVDHGTFGDIYHGTVYPSTTSTDDEGREVALKIDRLDSKKCTPETATKSYIEVRAEVSLLHKLQHPHVIDFIGVVLQPLCFVLEWAPGGSLHSVLTKYRKLDARVGPHTLQQAAVQVARGLSYLHYHKVVYYDLKSPNVLVFQFPSAQESLQQATQQFSSEGGPVYLKIADLGISRIMSPGGTMGFKGSPGFMAPEILKYVGMEAVTEKVDIYSFGMFMFELISLYFPFEKQNLMSSQIEKLVIDGERPPLQNRELSNPILYLDVMRWCWQHDFRSRPSADHLIEVISSDSVPRLVEAISLHGTSDITCSALSILPIEQSATEDYGVMSMTSSSTTQKYVARGDLQEDVWLGLYSEEGREREGESQVCVINFKGKASFSTQSFPVSNSRITSMCCVVDTVWVGTEEGQLFLYDAVTKNEILTRQLALLPGQAISNITHLPTLRQVLVTRSDGCMLIFDEVTQEHKLPDDSRYDNRLNGTQLPVRSAFKTPEKLPIFTALAVGGNSSDGKKTVWCGSRFEMLLLIDVQTMGLGYCRKCYNRPRNDITAEDHVTDLTLMVRGEESLVWALTRPHNRVHCWSTATEKMVLSVDCNVYSPSPVTCICSVGDKLQLAQSSGQILQLHTSPSGVDSTTELRGHVKAVHSMLTLGARTLPRHWRPSILGRSNVMDYLLELLGEDDIQDIYSSMIGRQTRLLVSVGCGFYGIAGKVVESLMSPRDISDNFLLLWSL